MIDRGGTPGTLTAAYRRGRKLAASGAGEVGLNTLLDRCRSAEARQQVRAGYEDELARYYGLLPGQKRDSNPVPTTESPEWSVVLEDQTGCEPAEILASGLTRPAAEDLARREMEARRNPDDVVTRKEGQAGCIFMVATPDGDTDDFRAVVCRDKHLRRIGLLRDATS